MRKWIFISIQLWPFKYNPVRQILTKVDFVRCRISYELISELKIEAIGLEDTLMNDKAKERFVNYNYAKRLYEIDKSLLTPSDFSDYVIITTNDIKTGSKNLSRFVRCKENSGFSVKIITEDDYGEIIGQPPNGIAEKIRQWLIDNYIELGIKYVLLIGDPDPDDPTNPDDHVGGVPMKMLYPRVGSGYYWNDYESPSDFFYADLTGNWNLDGDDLFGEHERFDQPITPDPQIEENTFSIRWTGKIEITDEDGARIAAYYDDGVRIWIDDLYNESVIDDWSDNIAGNSWYDILTPGLHDIKIEYY